MTADLSRTDLIGQMQQADNWESTEPPATEDRGRRCLAEFDPVCHTCSHVAWWRADDRAQLRASVRRSALPDQWLARDTLSGQVFGRTRQVLGTPYDPADAGD